MKGSVLRLFFMVSTILITIILTLPCMAAQEQVGMAATDNQGVALHLSLQELIEMVREKNERIQFQGLEWDITRDAIDNAESIFEPQFVASYLHDYSYIPKSIEDYSSLGFLDQNDSYRKHNNEYAAAMEGLLPSGGQVRFGYTLKELQSSLLDSSNIDSQYQTFVGVSLVQPLLKNAGFRVTKANIRVAEADAYMALQNYRREMLEIVAEATTAYWDLCLAKEKLGVRQDSVRIAEEILHDNRERVRNGKMAETEVIEAEAGLALRKTNEIASRQELTAAINAIKTLISMPSAETPGMIVASDQLVRKNMEVEFADSYKTSLYMRPEYLSTIKKIEKEEIRVAYAENQRWPQLDLKASYGLNGLGDDRLGESWNMAQRGEYESWTVGAEFRIPLMGGAKTRSELAAANKRKKQSLLELKATEVALANAVDTGVKNVRSALTQADGYAEAVRLNERLLEVELERLNAGLGNSRIVLEREEELNRTRESFLESLVNVEKALVALEAVKGTLLQNYGIDVMEAS